MTEAFTVRSYPPGQEARVDRVTGLPNAIDAYGFYARKGRYPVTITSPEGKTVAVFDAGGVEEACWVCKGEAEGCSVPVEELRAYQEGYAHGFRQGELNSAPTQPVETINQALMEALRAARDEMCGVDQRWEAVDRADAALLLAQGGR